MRSLVRRPTYRAPSRWAWRLERLMLTPAFRAMLRVGIPVFVFAAVGFFWLGNEDRRSALYDVVFEAKASFETRPEFMVHLMAIDGATDLVALDIREAVPLDFPLSSFDLDLGSIRDTIAGLDPVRSARARISPGGILQIDIVPRTPAVIWRDYDGLNMLDATGALVSEVPSRTARNDLPLIAGEGANLAVPEALALFQAASPLGARLRGIVRIGERRWDVVLDRGQRILLPEYDAVSAFERVIALDAAQDILARDVARIDMRLAARPTVQMNEEAIQEWWKIRQLSRQ